jgi:predicted transcriptional regulator
MPGAPNANGRHSILDLAPLELDCMNALWPLGEATVRDIQLALQPTTPRAYTTIMTILDRLAQKGIVLRRKSGRAWVYQPNLTAEDARSHALAQLVDGFFGGSKEGLAQHLATQRLLSAVDHPVAPRLDHAAGPVAARTRQREQTSAPEPEKTTAPNLDASLL